VSTSKHNRSLTTPGGDRFARENLREDMATEQQNQPPVDGKKVPKVRKFELLPNALVAKCTGKVKDYSS
jgi:hypothetical protein